MGLCPVAVRASPRQEGLSSSMDVEAELGGGMTLKYTVEDQGVRIVVDFGRVGPVPYLFLCRLFCVCMTDSCMHCVCRATSSEARESCDCSQ